MLWRRRSPAHRDEALEWFSEKLHLMLTFEGDPVAANYLLDAWPEGLLAHTANPTIPVFVLSAIAAQPQANMAPDVVRLMREQRPTTRRRFRVDFSKSASERKILVLLPPPLSLDSS